MHLCQVNKIKQDNGLTRSLAGHFHFRNFELNKADYKNMYERLDRHIVFGMDPVCIIICDSMGISYCLNSNL